LGVIAICDNLGPLDNFRSLPLLGEIKAGAFKPEDAGKMSSGAF